MTAGSLRVLNPQNVWGAETELNRDGFYPSLHTTLKPVTRVNYLPERDADKTPILECIDLGISFGGLKAVDNFNIALGRTEIAGLIGPNGAGKTTIFNLLTKVYQPTHGTILLDGKDIAYMTTEQVNRAGIARTFQNIRLFHNQTVIDNVLIGLHNEMHYTMLESVLRLPRYWKAEKVARERALEYLSLFHLEEHAEELGCSTSRRRA